MNFRGSNLRGCGTSTSVPTGRSTMLSNALLLASAIFVLLMLLAGPVRANYVDGYNHDYQGRIGVGIYTYIGFEKKGKTKLKQTGISVPVVCGDHAIGGVVAFPRVKKAFKVKYRSGGKTGKFSAKLPLKITSKNVKGTARIKGTVKGKRMKGTIFVRVQWPPYGRCVSGEYKWSAKRGKKVNVLTP